MSYSLAVPAPVPPLFRDIVDTLALPDLRCVGVVPADGPWPEGYLFFHRHGISTRRTEVKYADGKFQVQIFSLAAPEDCDLAFRFALKAAELLKAPIHSDGFGELPASQLRQVHDDAWIKSQLESGTRILVYMVLQNGEVIQSPGPVRPFYLGPRLLRELQAAGPPEGLPQRMLQAIRRVQYIDPEEYDPAGVFESAARGGDGVGPITFAVWGPAKNYLFPAVDQLLVDVDGKQTVFLIPYQALPEIAGARCSWLDEKQTLVQAFTEAEWPGLIQRARRHDLGFAKAPKKWWQFCKS